ncbi:MAG: HAMP domain-containing protein [Desulfobacterales bacterium]|nr:HAMP domain-containing protein [Desulfobacterales bacterium]
MFNNLKLGYKMAVGFGLIGIILAGAVLTTIIKVESANTVVNRLIDLRNPTSQMSLMLQNGINHSLAALRGWIILGDESFKKDRENTWKNEIESSIKSLQELSNSWTEEVNKTRLNSIITTIEEFKQVQKKIEDIAQSVDNTPAAKVLIHDAGPFIDTLVKNINTLINIEQTLEASQTRKDILGMMADVRGTTGLAISSLRSYLITGDIKDKNQFNQLWENNSKRFKNLSDNTLSLTPEQNNALKNFKEAREKFEKLADKMFEIRGGDTWNLSYKWMAEDVVPKANSIMEQLNAMILSQEELVNIDKNKVKSLTSGLKNIEWLLLFAGIILSAIIGFNITKKIVAPIKNAVVAVSRLADGDLTVEFKAESQDETGELLLAMKNMTEKLRSIMSNLATTTKELTDSSLELSSVSSQLASSSEEMNSQASTVAAASEQVTANVSTVAYSADQSSLSVSNISAMTEEMSATFAQVAILGQKTAEESNQIAEESGLMSNSTQTIAAAIEEMNASLKEVAKNTANASTISRNASKSAEETNLKMTALVGASKQIGKIVGVIKDIADQTNMLALNATIEAAGAGEAGKGFAVVAGEVKELARQSADATDEIDSQIQNIQKSTDDAVKAILQINEIITEIALINETIAAAVEEQTATSNEIAKSVAENSFRVKNLSKHANDSADLVKDIAKSTDEASSAAAEIAKNIDKLSKEVQDVAKSSNEAANGVKEISKNINGISIASKDTAAGASKTNNASGKLASMSKTLAEIVKKFKL